jgi:hypothetical protein
MTIDEAMTDLSTARTRQERIVALYELRDAVTSELLEIVPLRLHTSPPEPLGCREWRAYFDPEGHNGFGKTEDEAIRNLVLEVPDWQARSEDAARIGLALVRTEQTR